MVGFYAHLKFLWHFWYFELFCNTLQTWSIKSQFGTCQLQLVTKICIGPTQTLGFILCFLWNILERKKKISLNNGHTRNSIFARNSNNRFSSVRQQPGSIEHWFFKLLISLNEHIITVIQILFYSSSTVIFRVWLGYDELLDGSNTRDILHIPLTRLPLSENFSNFFLFSLSI